jgi:hypothetical protein
MAGRRLFFAIFFYQALNIGQKQNILTAEIIPIYVQKIIGIEVKVLAYSLQLLEAGLLIALFNF